MNHQLIPRLILSAVFVWAALETWRKEDAAKDRLVSLSVSVTLFGMLYWGGFFG